MQELNQRDFKMTSQNKAKGDENHLTNWFTDH